MSRAYRIKIAMGQISQAENRGLSLDIELIPICPPDRMRELLVQTLLRQGAREENGALVLSSSNQVEFIIDPEQLTLRISFDKLTTRHVNLYIEEEDLPRLGINLQENLEVTLEQIEEMGDALGNYVDEEVAKERVQVRQLLIEETFAARQAINRLLKDVYRDAVREKANTMGNITSVRESESDGEYRIRLELDA